MSAFRKLIQAALSYQASDLWFEDHPGEAHESAELEMHRDMVDEAIGVYLRSGEFDGETLQPDPADSDGDAS